MSGADTSLGGEERRFPETTWGLVARLRTSGDASLHGSLEPVCRRYWKPVYCYVRRAWAKSNEDAKDLTQAFWTWILEGGALRRYEPGKGSLRGYFKVLLRSFLSHQEEALQRLKRGGGVRIQGLDDAQGTPRDMLPDPRAIDPAEAFDREWWSTLVRNATERARDRLAASDRGLQFCLFEEYDLAAAQEKPSYRMLAERHGLSESEIRNHLFAVRELIRDEIRRELQDTTATPRDFEEEWNVLFG